MVMSDDQAETGPTSSLNQFISEEGDINVPGQRAKPTSELRISEINDQDEPEDGIVDVEQLKMEAYNQGKNHVVNGVNHALKIFWEVWRESLPFKTEIMKIVYLCLNKDRPRFLSEIIIKTLAQKGPAPQLFDVKHLTPLLSNDPSQDVIFDASFLVQGPVEATAETTVYIDWPKKYRIPVFVKAVVHSFSAKVRLKFSVDRGIENNYMQWIGQPKLRLSLEPIIGSDFDLKSFLPQVTKIIDDFIASQL